MTTPARRSPAGQRLPLVLAAAAALAAGVLMLGGALLDGVLRLPGALSTAVPGSAPAAGSTTDDRLAEALAALRRWDALRATAYAAGDPQRLAALYVDGSAAATADLEILRSYAARGLVVDRMRTQVLGVEPVRLGGEEVTLRVRDRLVGAEAVDEEGRRLVLPRDEASTRVLTLVRVGEEWRMKEVRQE